MSTPVWAVAVECWHVCLKNIQCLAETSTSLGRAVISLPSAVYEDDSTLHNIEVREREDGYNFRGYMIDDGFSIEFGYFHWSV